MALKSNYWSCSKFADWLRGTPKLDAATGPEWRDWKKEAKSKHPIRFWLAEEALDKIQNFICWPTEKLHSFKYHINNRFILRTHALTADPKYLPRGNWHDLNGRFLPCMFSELVNFVEVELAWWHIVWDDEANKKYRAPFWARGWVKISIWRCPEAGIENLEQQMKLVHDESWGIYPGNPIYGTPTNQAIQAKEVLELYRWWKEVYSNRPDPYDASGWSNYCELISINDDDDSGWFSFFDEKLSPEDQAVLASIGNKSREIEEEYKNEDEEMMIRLIKVRHSLWT